MPELPEVETISQDLDRMVKGRTIKKAWTDWPKYFRLQKNQKEFNNLISGKKILGVTRRGKSILIKLSGNCILLVHQKMSGHMLYGKWVAAKEVPKTKLGFGWEKEKWIPIPARGHMADRKNKFIRLIFFLDNNKMMALSDLRRFAKVLLGSEEEILNLAEIKNLGPEPLEKTFTFRLFRERIRKRRARIKPALLDQTIIVGVGNIYADEILYDAKIHPLSRLENLGEVELKSLYKSIKKILAVAVRRRGTSIDDFRDASGKKGGYGQKLKVFQRTGQPCPKGHIIERIKLAGRGTHFCPVEQKIY